MRRPSRAAEPGSTRASRRPTGAVAAGAAAEPSSSEFSEWMRNAMSPTTSTITAIAPAIEYRNSLGGVFLISFTALRATSRGCTLGFSGCARSDDTAGSGSARPLLEAEAGRYRLLSAAAVRSFQKSWGRAQPSWLLPPWTDRPETQVSRTQAQPSQPRRWRVPGKRSARSLSLGSGGLRPASPARLWKRRPRFPIPQPRRLLLPKPAQHLPGLTALARRPQKKAAPWR